MEQCHLSLEKRFIRVLLTTIFVLSVSCSSIFAADCGTKIPDGDYPLTGYYGNTVEDYESNDDGSVVTDHEGSEGKELMWEAVPPSFTYSWDSACFYCDNLELGGKTDWRLPSIKELNSIVDATYTPTINPSYFTVTEGLYWTSSIPQNYDTNAWAVSFTDGMTSISPQTGELYVRCVRNTDASSGGNLSLKIAVKTLDDTTVADTDTDGVPDATLVSVDSPYLVPEATTDTTGIGFNITEVKNSEGSSVTDNLTIKWTVDKTWGPVGGTSHLTPTQITVKTYNVADIGTDVWSYGIDVDGELMVIEDGAAFPDIVDPADTTKDEAATYTVTLQVWDHNYPQAYGEMTFTVTICADGCDDEKYTLDLAPVFVSNTMIMTMPYLNIKATADSKDVITAENIKLKYVTDLDDERILFQLLLAEDQGDEVKDKDNDGYTYDGSVGTAGSTKKDCDDNNPFINPGAEEVNGNGVNEDCVDSIFD